MRQDKLENLNAQQKIQEVEELKKNLTFQQTFFTRAKSQSEAVVKASFILAEQRAKPWNTSSEIRLLLFCEMATDLRTQLCERSKDFIAYSLAVDESTDIMDLTQLAILIRGVDSNLFTHGTTKGKYIFENLTADHCIMHKETLCGKFLKMEHVMSNVTQNINFIQAKGLNDRQFHSFVQEIDSESLSYRGSLAELGKSYFIEFLSSAKKPAFQAKLLLWESQMHHLPHFPRLFPNAHFSDKLSALRTEFAQRFGDFGAEKDHFELLRNPFTVDMETAPVQIQMELIELQCNGTLKAKYDTEGPALFIRSIPEAIPQLRLHAARTLCMFILCNKCSISRGSEALFGKGENDSDFFLLLSTVCLSVQIPCKFSSLLKSLSMFVPRFLLWTLFGFAWSHSCCPDRLCYRVKGKCFPNCLCVLDIFTSVI
uniref:DUF4371 domain-containing protein n=1 Tax=Haplochromis burtoni TaxID=8153 RepID=A0A3Q2X4A3_HAPBU